MKTKSNPKQKKIRDYMTSSPETIGLGETLRRAGEIMVGKEIRHLPVLLGQEIIGLISDRGLKAALLSKWADDLKVSDILIPEPYLVSKDSTLETVIDKMVEERIDCAIVTDKQNRVAGIFTTFDALKALQGVLHQKPHQVARAGHPKQRPHLQIVKH